MDRKGINQIDFAIGTSILIILFVFVVSNVSSYYSGPMQSLETSKLMTYAFNLERTAFENKGVPTDWHWRNSTTRPSLGTTIWKVPVFLEEWNDTGYSNLVMEVPIETGNTNGVANAWEGSIKAYDGSKALPTYVDAKTDIDNDGFLESFNVSFEIDINPNESKTVSVYYSQDNLTSSGYTSLSTDVNVTVNTTLLSERGIKGITPYKLESLQNISLEEVKEKYDLERNFNLSLNTPEYYFSYGLTPPEKTSVESYSTKILFQNKTGHIKLSEVKATVW